MQYTPAKIFHLVFNGGKNFITPYVDSFGWITKDHVAYELSYGTGMSGSPLYGVTLLSTNLKAERNTQYDRCFTSKELAEAYITELQQKGVRL